MHVAIAQSEHFQWVAFGPTPHQAKRALVDAFNGTTNLPITVGRFESMYGITVLPATPGTAYRDGEPVPPRRG